MKIAMLGHKVMPSRLGGVEVVVSELATRMAALGHDVIVYNRSSGTSTPITEYNGVRIKTVPTIKVKGLAAASSSFFATQAALNDKPDIIHFHAEGPCAMMGMASQAGIGRIATIHGLDWQRAKWGNFASRYIKYGEKAAVKHADEIIVLSKNVQSYFDETYGRDTVFISNGIDKKKHAEADLIRNKYGLEKGSFFLFVGRIVPEKGLHYLINAFRQLETDKRLVVAGGSSDSLEYFEAMKQLAKSDNRIIFTGFAEGRFLEELFSNAYAYVLPSDIEGMPMSLLEAMAFGNCCVVSNIPENSGVIGSCGLQFEKGSETSLKDALVKLETDPSLVNLLRRESASHVLAAYNWDDVVNKTLELYERVLKEKI